MRLTPPLFLYVENHFYGFTENLTFPPSSSSCLHEHMHLDQFWGLNESYQKTDLVVVFSKYLILLDPWVSKLDLIYYGYDISNRAYSAKDLNIKYLILLDPWLSKLDLKYYIHNAIDSNFISLAE